MKRALGIGIGLIVALFVTVAVGLWLLTGTATGSRWLVTQAMALAPGELRIGATRGALLRNFQVSDLQYHRNGLTVRLEEGRINLDLSALLSGQVHAERIALEGLDIDLPPQQPSEAAPAGTPPNVRLPVDLFVTEGKLENFHLHRGEQSLLRLDKVQLDDGKWEKWLAFDALKVDQGQVHLEVRGRLMLSAPHSLDLKLTWEAPLPPPLATYLKGGNTARGRASLNGNLARITGQHRLLEPKQLATALTVQPFAAPLELALHNSWEKLVLPAGAREVTLSDGELAITGSLNQLHASGRSTARYADFPTARITLDADGTLQSAQHLNVTLTHDATELAARGSARWAPAPAFDLALTGKQLNPALLLDSWPGNLALQAKLDGRSEDGQWKVAASNVHLSGKLKKKPLILEGDATLDGGALTLNTRAGYAGNTLAVQGTAAEQLALQGELGLKAPQRLHPALDGELSGTFALQGSRQTPRLDLNLSGPRLVFQQYAAMSPRVRASDLGLDSANMSLSLQASELRHNGNPVLTGLEAALDGSSRNHTLRWQLDHRQGLAKGELSGGVDAQSRIWQGSLDALTLAPQSILVPAWELKQSAPLTLGPGQVNLARACLASMIGSACGHFRQQARKVDAALDLSSFPLLALSEMLGSRVKLQGELGANARLERDAQGHWQGHLTSEVKEGVIEFPDEPSPYPLTIEEAVVEARLGQQRLDGEARLTLHKHGSAAASFSLPVADPQEQVSGQLDMAVTDLSWLELVLPQIRKTAGQLRGRLQLAGTRAQPRVTGNLALRKGMAQVPETGIQITDATLRAQGTGTSTITFSGSARSGPGTVNLNGSLDLAQGLTDSLALRIEGERFQVVSLRDMQALANPDLSLRFDRNILRVRGNVSIPQAEITPRTPPERVVRVSEDQVLIRQQQESARSPLAINADVALVLGENIVFRGFGLEAQPDGRIVLIKQPEKPLRLRGELRIEKGRYRAYGQNLQITRGVLLFQDAPDNPALDIRAIRRIPSAEVVVGVRIGGTLKQPEASIFSEPPMEESEAMAWLLTGRSLAGTSQADNARIAQALALYGLEKGSGVTENIGEKLGVDEISIGSTWETEDAALMLGKQINDRLYLRYAAGLFDAVSTVMLRYTLNRNLHLEAQTGGDRQSLDLIYQIER